MNSKILSAAVAVSFLGLVATYFVCQKTITEQTEQVAQLRTELSEVRTQQETQNKSATKLQKDLAQVQSEQELYGKGFEKIELELGNTRARTEQGLADLNQRIDNLEIAYANSRPLNEIPVPTVATLNAANVKPHSLNIDFGVWKPTESKKVGPAAVGKEGDFWNVVGVPWNDDHTESGLLSTHKTASSILVELVNLGGGWGCNGGLGMKDIMLDNFNYPANNKGGNSRVILSSIPSGTYDLYLYGHGTDPAYFGDYTVVAGGKSYGRKATSNQLDAVTDSKWSEGKQFVKYSGITIGAGNTLDILIQPGGQVSDNGTRHFSDAMIAGLQLVLKE